MLNQILEPNWSKLIQKSNRTDQFGYRLHTSKIMVVQIEPKYSNLLLVRLDWCLVSEVDDAFFQNIEVRHRGRHKSNHALLIIRWNNSRVQRRKLREFKFEAMWLKHVDCEDAVRRGWNRGKDSWEESMTWSRLKRCGESLKEWNNQVFGTVNIQLREKKH